jgi:hypothetical protein
LVISIVTKLEEEVLSEWDGATCEIVNFYFNIIVVENKNCPRRRRKVNGCLYFRSGYDEVREIEGSSRNNDD